MALSVCCQKGGTGKTLLATNLALGFAQAGKRTLLLDMDPQGNASSILAPRAGAGAGAAELILGRVGLTDCTIPSPHHKNLHLIPAGKTLADAAVLLAGETGRDLRIRHALIGSDFDEVVIDCPPGRDLLSLNSLAASRCFLLVTDPSPFGAAGLQGLIDLADGVRKFLPQSDSPQAPELAGVVLNRVQRGKVHQQAVESIRQHFGSRLLAVLPHAIAVDAANWNLEPLLIHAPESPVADGLQAIIKRLLSMGGTHNAAA